MEKIHLNMVILGKTSVREILKELSSNIYSNNLLEFLFSRTPKSPFEILFLRTLPIGRSLYSSGRIIDDRVKFSCLFKIVFQDNPA